MAKFASSKDGTVNYRVEIYEDGYENVPSIENMTSFRYTAGSGGKGIRTLTIRPALTDYEITAKITAYVQSRQGVRIRDIVDIIEKGTKTRYN